MPPLSTSAVAVAYILTNYALGKARSLERLSGGTTQANYLLRASAGDFVIRSYETRSAEYVSFEIDALNQLSAANFQCQRPIADIRGRFIGEHNKKPFAVFRYIEGEHDDSKRNHVQVASAVAKMHHVSQAMRFVSLVSRERYDQQSCLRTAESNLLSSHSNDMAAPASLEWLKNEVANLHLPDGLPVGLCHCDLNPSNFLYSNGTLVAMLDFDAFGN